MTFSCCGTLEIVYANTVTILVHMAPELAIEKFYTLSACLFFVVLCLLVTV